MLDYPKIVNQLGFFCALLVTLFGLTVFLGWCFEIEYLKGSISSGISVKTNTAICFFLSGLTLLLQHPQFKSAPAIKLSRGISVFIFVLATSNLSQHIFGWDLGIDQLIFKETSAQILGSMPNRMGPPASVNFILSALALFLISSRKHNLGSQTASCLAVTIAMLSSLSIVGYLFNASELYGLAKYTSISLPSALAFFCIAISLLFVIPNGEIKSLLVATNSAGILARRLLPAAILLPVLLSMVMTLGERRDYYDANFGASLLVIFIIFIFSRLVWTSVLALSKSDSKLMQLIESEKVAKIQAERANRFKDEFLTTLSHELRTPLNAILGWSQILKRKEPSTEELRKGIDTIERNARLQAQLIEDLLDMNKIMSGKLVLNLAPVDLNQIISEAIQTVEPLALKKSISIKYNPQLDQQFVNADSTRLHQIFWNILSNAVKFTPTQGLITVAAKKSAAEAILEISDNGEGIEKNVLKHIFDRFTQGDSTITRRHGGLGLGLSIVKELVHAHGGQIKAYSSGPGKGSCFTVILPLASATEKIFTNPELDVIKDLPDEISLDGLKVLLVDDDRDSLELTAKILSQNKAEIISVTSCDEALNKLTERPELIISDIGMPEKDGYQLIREIRANKELEISSIPAIALTAFGSETEKDRALASGYNIHLSKPLNRHLLIKTVMALIKKAPRF